VPPDRIQSRDPKRICGDNRDASEVPAIEILSTGLSDRRRIVDYSRRVDFVSPSKTMRKGGAMLPPNPMIVGPTVRKSRATQGPSDWVSLASESHRDGIQERIRHAIRAGTIRVGPWPGDSDRVRIIPGPVESP
jgi:hypothetical protein